MENFKAKKMGLHEKKRAQAHMVAKARPQQIGPSNPSRISPGDRAHPSLFSTIGPSNVAQRRYPSPAYCVIIDDISVCMQISFVFV
jgi:hypothetical protein